MSRSGAVLTINLGNISSNYKSLSGMMRGQARAGTAVKADGYGLGAGPVSIALEQAGCRDFFVSSLDEGLALRQHIKEARIYVLNGFYGSGAPEYAAHGLIPVLGSFMEIEGYRALASRLGQSLPAWLHFNTRMNRLGLGAVETEKLLQDLSMLDGVEITGICSHFACADEAGHPMMETQYRLFAGIARHFPRAAKSLANSSGIFRSPEYHFDIVRPGMALYGLNPMPEAANPMRPVVGLTAPVLRVRMVYKDAVVGYGGTYRFEKDSWIATVAAGYADGLFRALSNRGALYWKGHRCPIRGRVSMDLTTVDLSDVPEKERPRPGDSMEILGVHQDADALAADAGTIGYEILTALGSRYERSYIA